MTAEAPPSPPNYANPAHEEIDELGPEPSGSELELWREERWGAVVLLGGLADDNAERLGAAANGVADEWASQPVRELLLDAVPGTRLVHRSRRRPTGLCERRARSTTQRT